MSDVPPVVETRVRRVTVRSIVGVMLVVLLGAALFVDASGPEANVLAPRVAPPATGGAWACPLVSTGRLGGALHLANVGDAPSTVRVTWVRPPLKPVTSSVKLAPVHAASVPAPTTRSDVPVSAIVEWSGGEVVAGRGMLAPAPAHHAIALGGACSRPGDPVLVAPGLSTVSGDTQIVILNPSSADALVAVSFLVDGDENTPENTHAISVPARSRTVVDAGDYVFDKAHFAAVVRVTTGAVVADAERLGPTSGYLIPASAPRTGGVAVTQRFLGAQLEIVTIGDDPTTVEATTITAATRASTAGLAPVLDPAMPTLVAFPGPGPLAVSLSESAGSPFSAVLVWDRRTAGGSERDAVPVAGIASRWIGVTGPPATSGRDIRLVLANDGDRPANVHVRLFGGSGPFDAGAVASVTVPAGRAGSYPLPMARGSSFGFEVTSDAPVAVSIFGVGVLAKAPFVFASAAYPVADYPPVPLVVDPRAGVDAR